MIKSIDAELITGLKNEDQRAINEIYRRYFQTINQFIIMNHGNKEDAKDIFQEAMMVVFENTRKKSLELTCSLKTYIYSIVRNIWYKKGRSTNNLPEFINSSDKDEILENVIDEEDIELIKWNERRVFIYKMFNQLTKNCQKLLKLFLDGLNLVEVTNIMKFKNVQYTKNQRYRCKKSLITKMRNNPRYYALKNENYSTNY
ncbi:MAG: sigma-70 family RNA polymerase sigma factor [Bacteroidales bacterium]|nr:sigma-70 family RNA polymerase sigma factor [Bacteroidales bacterium]